MALKKHATWVLLLSQYVRYVRYVCVYLYKNRLKTQSTVLNVFIRNIPSERTRKAAIQITKIPHLYFIDKTYKKTQQVTTTAHWNDDVMEFQNPIYGTEDTQKSIPEHERSMFHFETGIDVLLSEEGEGEREWN